jgi:predicted 3-demethylubiquinone-9 3-methyltransferase (glyoxalase superfamily)
VTEAKALYPGATISEVLTKEFRLDGVPFVEVDAAVIVQHSDGTTDVLIGEHKSGCGYNDVQKFLNTPGKLRCGTFRF